MRLAAAGAPNRMLTLTCAPLAEPDAERARAVLHHAWRTLRLTIAREFVKPSDSRWRLPVTGLASKSRGVRRQSETARLKATPPALPYFAVVERHRSGRPHLHVLLRCGYIPQRWLSRQMMRLAQSPICDIRKVASTKQAAAYVAKYIGKAPARFGSSRAYWYSRTWAPAAPAAPEEQPQQKQWFTVRSRRWEETRAEIDTVAPIIDVSADGWFALSPGAAPLGSYVVTGRYGNIIARQRPPPTAPDADAGNSPANRW